MPLESSDVRRASRRLVAGFRPASHAGRGLQFGDEQIEEALTRRVRISPTTSQGVMHFGACSGSIEKTCVRYILSDITYSTFRRLGWRLEEAAASSKRSDVWRSTSKN